MILSKIRLVGNGKKFLVKYFDKEVIVKKIREDSPHIGKNETNVKNTILSTIMTLR